MLEFENSRNLKQTQAKVMLKTPGLVFLLLFDVLFVKYYVTFAVGFFKSSCGYCKVLFKIY